MSKSLLIVIDVQNGFLNEYTKELPNKIREYLIKNKRKYDFTVFTKFLNKPNSNFVKQIKWSGCIDPNETEIAKELKDFINENNLFEKTTYSSFKSERLIGFIKEKKITKIFLCGLNVDACVLASAFEAFDLGFEVHILKELTNTFWGPKEYTDLMLRNLGYKIDLNLLDN